MSDFSHLKINNRLYYYLRTSTITNLDDALVELITNSVDAYLDALFNANKIININYSKKNKYIEVFDNAIGLDSDEMEKCFFQVGAYTANDFTRGHFSRGAKDIIALGNLTIVAIKNNKLSTCKLFNDGRCGFINKDINVNDTDRLTFGITDNGLYSKLEIINDTVLEKFNLDNFKIHYALRDIFSNDTITINYNNIDEKTSEILKYNYPEGKLLIDGDYEIEAYGTTANFKCYYNENLIKNSNFKYNENGFLISSDNNIYENGMLHCKYINNNIYSTKIHGMIKCNYINELIKDFEKNGPTDKNPFPIIDSSRMTGLSYEHPFTKELLKLPIERVMYILVDLEYNSKNYDNQYTDVLKNLSELQIIGNDIFKNLGIKLESDFLLPIASSQYPKLRKNFKSENDNLPYSRKNIRKKNKKNKINPNKNDVKEDTEASKLTVNFVKEITNAKYKYIVSKKGIDINIPLNSYILSKFNKSENNLDEFSDLRSKIYIADIITEALADIITNNEFDTKNENLTNAELLDTYNSLFHDNYSKLEKKIFEIFNI
jgi:hypothetical protein